MTAQPQAQSRSQAQDAPPPVISVRDLSMVYRARAGETVALQNATLEVQAGEFVSLIGPSGCGKTTLLRLIADLIEPTSGTLQVAGKTPKEAREAREYGYVFQAPVLYEWRTVVKNVMLPSRSCVFPKLSGSSARCVFSNSSV